MKVHIEHTHHNRSVAVYLYETLPIHYRYYYFNDGELSFLDVDRSTVLMDDSIKPLIRMPLDLYEHLEGAL
jgi:hypothetical protein